MIEYKNRICYMEIRNTTGNAFVIPTIVVTPSKYFFKTHKIDSLGTRCIGFYFLVWCLLIVFTSSICKEYVPPFKERMRLKKKKVK